MSTGNITFEWRQGEPWLLLTGDVDMRAAETVTDAVLARYETDGTLNVDVRAVTFLDSVGLGLLLRLRQVAGEVRLVDPPRQVSRLLDLCGVGPLFTVAALAA